MENLSLDFKYSRQYKYLIDLLFNACGSDNIDYIELQLEEIKRVIIENNIGGVENGKR